MSPASATSPARLAARLRALLLPGGRAEVVGLLLGGVLFVAILAAAQRTDEAISPPGLVAALVLSFLFCPRAARELVGPVPRGRPVPVPVQPPPPVKVLNHPRPEA